MVLRAREDVVVKEFLPVFMQSDIFFERAFVNPGRLIVAHYQLENAGGSGVRDPAQGRAAPDRRDSVGGRGKRSPLL